MTSSGSLTSTTPPRPDQYFVPAASMDITRSVDAARASSSASATRRNLARLSSQTPWTKAEPVAAAPRAKTTAAPLKAAVAASARHAGRRAATHATATAIPSNARM
jgi:hypothetical protein